MSPDRVIIALDLATRSGFSIGRPGETPRFGSIRFGTESGEIISNLQTWLIDLLREHNPGLIAVESPYIPTPREPQFIKSGLDAGKLRRGPPPMNVHTLRRLIGMVETVKSLAWRWGIEYDEPTTGSIYSFFVGGRRLGRDEKKAATIKMCRLMGWNVGDDDNAGDALALWHYSEHRIAPAIAMRRGGGKLATGLFGGRVGCASEPGATPIVSGSRRSTMRAPRSRR